MIMSRIFSSAEPGPQLTWTAMRKNTMRVLHVIDSLVLGGAEVLVKDLAPRMRARGIDFEVLILRRTNSPVEVAVRESGVPVHDTELKNLYSPVQIAKLARIVDRYDVVHVQ